MKLSVVVCTYNGSRYLKEQLDSIKDQIRQADEVLLFDDRSADDTLEIAARYIEANGLSSWRLSVNEKNLGYIENFRQAIAAAGGDWIVLCDQDDLWTKDKLASMEACAKRHPDARAIAADFTIINANGASGDPSLRHTIQRGVRLPSAQAGSRLPSFIDDPCLLLVKNFAPGCTMAFSKEIRAVYLKETKGEIPHDWELLLISQMLGGLYFLPAQFTRYRIHGNNTIGVKARTVGAPSLLGRLQTMDSLDAVQNVADRYAKSLLGRGVDNSYRQFLAARRRSLETGSLKDYWKMASRIRVYRRMFSPKERLGDLYAIGKRLIRKSEP